MNSFQTSFQSLIGDWKLERKISDGSCFNGMARFSLLNENSVGLLETGVMKLHSGHQVEANRSWVWQMKTPEVLEIFYDENPLRSYHCLKLRFENDVWIGEAIHHCSPDVYEGFYQFNDDSFLIRQKVSGPKKDYTMETVYSA